MSQAHTVLVATRRVLVRRPWIHWVSIAVVAAAIATSVHGRLQQVDRQRDSWGTTRTVLVASRPIGVGDPLLVEPTDVPVAIVPEAAIDADPPLDPATVARRQIGIGEIVTQIDVVADAGPQAMTPDGWLAVPVVESPRSGAGLGDRVQVASDGFVISIDAVVVGVLDDITLLAVPAGEAPLLPAASSAGALTLLLKP